MRQRAALLAALIHSPELLFLDEPTSGLDPAARAEVHRMLGELKEAGTTVFLTTHDMSEADSVCDRVAILNEGHIAACDTPDKLKLAHARNKVTIHTKTRGVVSTTKDKDLFKGDISELPEELLNIPIYAWDKRDGIYITI